jgi:hypothetical protein
VGELTQTEFDATGLVEAGNCPNNERVRPQLFFSAHYCHCPHFTGSRAVRLTPADVCLQIVTDCVKLGCQVGLHFSSCGMRVFSRVAV